MSGSPRDKQRLLIHEKTKDTTLILQRQTTLPFSTRKRTVHVDRIVVPGSPPTNRSVPRVSPPITAYRWTLRIPTRPQQTPVCELHVIFLVLAGNRQRVGKLGGELVWIGDVDGLANGEGIADGFMADVGLVVVVDELDDGEEILVVAGAGLRLSQVEGACAGGISGRRRRRRRSSAFGVGMGIVSL